MVEILVVAGSLIALIAIFITIDYFLKKAQDDDNVHRRGGNDGYPDR
jgi:flagellar biogenesis protein FliO